MAMIPMPEMASLFIAHGPAFRSGVIDSFQNTAITPLLRHLIGLPQAQRADGSLAEVAGPSRRKSRASAERARPTPLSLNGETIVVDKSEKFSTLVRIGYFSRAILYSVLGLIALTSAGRIGEGTNGILSHSRVSAGHRDPLAYGCRPACLCTVPLRLDRARCRTPRYRQHRLGHADRSCGSAIGHLALAYSAYKFATSGSDNGGGAQEAASGVLAVEFGGIVLGLLGTFFATAVLQAKKGITGSFMNRITPRPIAGRADWRRRLPRPRGLPHHRLVAVQGRLHERWFGPDQDAGRRGGEPRRRRHCLHARRDRHSRLRAFQPRAFPLSDH